MGIVFFGDVSLPPGLSPGLPTDFPDFEVPAIANLEGPILELDRWTTGLWNSPGVLDFLIRCRVRAVALANNHITDLGAAPSATREQLASAGIVSFGAGVSTSEAAEPLLVDDGDEVLVLLGFGWEVIGCKPPCTTQGGVNLHESQPHAALDLARTTQPPRRAHRCIHALELRRRTLPATRASTAGIRDG